MDQDLENLDDVEIDEVDTQDGNDLVKNLRKQLKSTLKQNRENAERLEKLEKKQAIDGAKLNLNESQQVALLAAHGDKEFTPDALRETAAALKFIPDAGVEVSPDEAAALGRVAEASATNSTAVDPNLDFNQELQNIIANGGSQKDMIKFLESYQVNGAGWADQVTSRWREATGS